ncbi:MAG: diguanylate cyclase, partial [Abitibacteriaceae bacterium]|nr:diguanylate cyclase [Abditibacteriaceae bacterium]
MSIEAPQNPSDSLAEDILRLTQSTRQQQAIRRWILLLPLTTAVVGAALVRVGLQDEYGAYLPAIFFIGALLVTAAMLHQRRMLDLMISLAQRLHTAYGRIDGLHRLAVELNQPLNTVQVGQTVLNYTLQSLDAMQGAFWLRNDFVPASLLKPDATATLTTGDTPEASRRRWYRVAVQDVDTSEGHRLLDAWEKILERDDGITEVQQYRIEGGGDDSTLLGQVTQVADSTFALPILWKDECIGVLLINDQRHRLKREDRTFLSDVALGVGPALQNALLYQSATERAEIDGLTRLYNHRAIQERLNQEVARLQRAQAKGAEVKLSVAMMDLTDFKLFNDSYGHAVGDQVLRSVSECLRRTFRASDVVGRYGGDEFIALLPDTNYAGAETLCSRIIETLRAGVLTAADGSPINIRLACGVATFPHDGQHVSDLLEAADGRLYEAKERGELLIKTTSDSPAVEVAVVESPDKPNWKSIGLMESIIEAIDQKDHYTKQHSERVWKYASLIADELAVTPETREAIHLSSLLFDVGKIVMPHAVLRKPGRLSP